MNILHRHKVVEPVRSAEEIARIKAARRAAMAPERFAPNRFITAQR